MGSPVSGGSGGRRVPLQSILVGTLAVLLLVASVFGDVSDAIGVALIGAAVVLVAVAVWSSRIQGKVKVSATGIEFELPLAEQQVGQSVKYPLLEPGDIDIGFAGGGGPIPGIGVPGPTVLPQEEYAREVRLVPPVWQFLATSLTDKEKPLVESALKAMRTSDFRVDADPERSQNGRLYRVHHVPDTEVQVWYRPLSDEEPDTLVVLAIERDDDE